MLRILAFCILFTFIFPAKSQTFNPGIQLTKSAPNINFKRLSTTSNLRQTNDERIRLDSVISYFKSPVLTDSLQYYKYIYRYENEGKFIGAEFNIFLDQQYNGFFVTEYDEQGNRSAIIAYSISLPENDTLLDEKTEYTYYKKDLPGSITLHSWSDLENKLIPDEKIEYTYNDNDKVILEKTSYWNNEQWQLSKTSNYKYENDLLIRVEDYWPSGKIYEKSEYTYTPTNQINDISDYTLYSDWELSEYTKLTYDEFSNTTQILEQQFSAGEVIWNKSTTLEFDYTVLSKDLIQTFELEDNNSYYNIPVKMTSSITNFGEEEGELITIFYYSNAQTTGSIAHSEIQFNIFPNPASEYLFIENKTDKNELTIQILNSGGDVIINETITNQRKISTNNLKPGVYFIKASNMNSISTEKIIIR